MERRKALALTSLLMVLLASFALTAPTSAEYAKNERYLVMGGALDSLTQMGIFPVSHSPFATRAPWLTPGEMALNITYSNSWTSAQYGDIVNLTVPAESYAGVYHEWYDESSDLWFTLSHYMAEDDGYGWIFLDDQKGDVDCYTLHNNTGAYWKSPSPKLGELAASVGSVPSPGPDGVAGTDDDGFGDGTKDPPGSSILILPSKLLCKWASGDDPFGTYYTLFDIAWPVVFTTGTSYGIVDEPASAIDGANATKIGKPVEKLHSGTPWDDPDANVYVSYASCWGMLDVFTPDWGDLDVFYYLTTYNVREDEAIWGDVTMDGVVDSTDDGTFGVAYGAIDEFRGNSPATPEFDARCDFNNDNVVDSTDDGTFGVYWGAILLG